jgi:hypothetical protein
MSRMKIPLWTASFFLVAAQAFAAVPSVHFRRPDVPGFLQSMDLQTVQMQVFPREASGMVPDPFGDLSWNPACLADLARKTAYLDFLSYEPSPLFPVHGEGASFTDARSAPGDWISPRWYPQTTVRSAQTVPLYNFGILIPLGAKWKAAFLNRTVFDYGPFLQGYGSSWEGAASDAKADYGSRSPQRLETDHNQQTVAGNKLEISISCSLSTKWDAGFRFGHMAYDRHGELVDDRWAEYPHSSFGYLEDESLEIDGRHVETGIGLVFHPDSATRLGLYAGWISGNGSETSVSLDTSCTWSETDVNPKYYGGAYSRLSSSGAFEQTGSRPQLKFIFERKWSPRWTMRSFVSGAWSTVDVTGSLGGGDTTAFDRTGDYYESDGSIHFRRTRGHGSRSSGLSGNGKEESRMWQGFVSLIYSPDGPWSLFGGLVLQHFTCRQQFDENTFFHSHQWNENSLYKSDNSRNVSIQRTEYALKTDYTRWSLFIPAGLRVSVGHGLSVLIGSGAAFTLEDQGSEGDRLYPVVASQKWKDGKLLVDDVETDRAEVFSSNPAGVLTRQWGRYFGLAYRHASGANLYMRFADDVSKMDNWSIGFETAW